MVDEHTRVSQLNIVDRSITAERPVAELKKVFAAAVGPPKALQMDNRPELIYPALQQFCDCTTGTSHIPLGAPWNNRHIDSFSNDYARSASTATTGTPCSRPGWSSATTRTTSATTDTAIQHSASSTIEA